jgi:hypothetical protein
MVLPDWCPRLITANKLRIYCLLLPLCVFLEVLMAQSMEAVGPQYPVHMSLFCGACGIMETTRKFGICLYFILSMFWYVDFGLLSILVFSFYYNQLTLQLFMA